MFECVVVNVRRRRQLLKYVNINRPMTVVWLSYARCFYTIVGTALIFLGCVAAFAQFAYLAFGGATDAFLTLPISM